MFQSIKFKITCWYTGIIVVVFLIVLGGAFAASEHYSEGSVKAELEDELKDLEEDMIHYPEYFPKVDLVSYYDDGVMLSIYDENEEFINGVFPDGFPLDVPFQDEKTQKIRRGEENWFLMDRQTSLPDGTVIWIRGVHSFSSITVMIQRLTMLVCILCPLLILFTAFIGYRMIQRSLSPIHTMISTVNEITASSSLSTRLPVPKTQDEFYELSETFNRMFENLEQHFQREKQFSSDAAHELRTPVSIILSHCEYCLEEMELSREEREEMEIIRDKALQMSHLVSQLLEISRAETHRYKPDFEDVDLQNLAESVLEEMEEKAAAKNIRLELDNRLKDPVIQGDLSQLTRLFINIVDNGISYGRDSGYVKIHLESIGPRVSIQFEDDGVGMDEEIQDKIWSRFYRADASRSDSQGFGLGLFMVKQIVECHKGKIKVESSPSRGTVFTVLLNRKQNVSIQDNR